MGALAIVADGENASKENPDVSILGNPAREASPGRREMSSLHAALLNVTAQFSRIRRSCTKGCDFGNPTMTRFKNCCVATWWKASARNKNWWRLGTAFFLLSATALSLQMFRTQTLSLDPLKYQNLATFYVAYPNEYHFIQDRPDLCKKQSPFVVVIVPVAPHQVEARDAIRTTWGNDSLVRNGMVLVLFLLGVPGGNVSEEQRQRLRQEHLLHRDLLQSDFVDSYRNLTIKTMVMLEWLWKRCPKALYAVKADADMLLNIQGLVKMLLRFNKPPSNYITGLVWYGNVAIRDPSSKFYVPYEVYPNSVYPPYPLGMCYIISMDLAEKIIRVSKEIKPIFIEDLYIGLCLERLNIAPSDPPDIGQFVVNPPHAYDRCYYSSLIAVVTHSPAELVAYWTDIHKPGGPPC